MARARAAPLRAAFGLVREWGFLGAVLAMAASILLTWQPDVFLPASPVFAGFMLLVLVWNSLKIA